MVTAAQQGPLLETKVHIMYPVMSRSTHVTLFDGVVENSDIELQKCINKIMHGNICLGDLEEDENKLIQNQE